MKSQLKILSPAELENHVEPRDALEATVEYLNSMLSDPQQRARYEHSFGNDRFISIDYNVTLTMEQAQALLSICLGSGWVNVQVLYSLGIVTVNLCNQGNLYWPSNYKGKPFGTDFLAPLAA